MKIPGKNNSLPKVWVAVFGLAGIGLLLIYGAAVLAVIGTLWLTFMLLKKMFWG